LGWAKVLILLRSLGAAHIQKLVRVLRIHRIGTACTCLVLDCWQTSKHAHRVAAPHGGELTILVRGWNLIHLEVLFSVGNLRVQILYKEQPNL
jgi:hypothetical protein